MSVITSAKNFLARAFPVPKFLLLSNISVSISDGELSFFEFESSGGKLLPKAHGKKSIPLIRLGTINEKQKSETISALKSFVNEQKISLVHVLIHEGDTYVFRLTVPTVNREELKFAIESVLEENVPIPPAEASFEYDIVSVDNVRGETSVAVSVISEKIINDYNNLFSQGGLVPIAFETEARALARAIFSPEEKGVSLVLAIKPSHSIICITENGRVVFSSSIDLGSLDINKAIAKTFDVTPEVAIDMKKQHVSGDGADTSVFDASLPVFSSFHDEIGKVLVFWKTQEKKIKDFQNISRIILVGSDSIVSSFARYVSISFKLPAVVGSVWTNVLSVEETIPDLSLKDSLDYGSSIGALLP